MSLTKLVLDYSKWRCGKGGIYKLGIGQTLLKNSEGFMCCLGQWCEQAGVPETKFLHITTPANLNESLPPLTCLSKDGGNINSEFAINAIQINDALNTTPEEKIIALRQLLLLSQGIELEVINKPEINLQD